jgi:hypothetical protein
VNTREKSRAGEEIRREDLIHLGREERLLRERILYFLPVPELLERADYREVSLQGEGDGHIHTGSHAGLEQGVESDEQEHIDFSPEPMGDCMVQGTSSGSSSRNH